MLFTTVERGTSLDRHRASYCAGAESSRTMPLLTAGARSDGSPLGPYDNEGLTRPVVSDQGP